MRIKKFTIKNYRAIDELVLPLSHEMLPIIGINESGKTTILTALRSFDYRSDRNDNGLHLIHKNRYTIGDDTSAEITATLRLSEAERKELHKSISEQHGSEHQFLDKDYEFHLTRTIPPARGTNPRPEPTPVQSYSLDNDIDATIRTKVVRFLRDRIPVVLYFDDFNDRVPDDISIPEHYQPDKSHGRDKNKPWKDIIYEVFKRAGTTNDEQSALDTYLKCTDPLDQKNIIKAITKVLNKEIIGEWKKLKRHTSALADDSENLELELTPTRDAHDNSTRFEFLVNETIDHDTHAFKVTERSKGFQWFFNYTMKLKFNSQYAGTDVTNAIFLLDEPGSYLHSRAQSELLSELRSVAEKNTIIFCTHSQYLLDPHKIRLSSITIAHRENDNIRATRFGDYHESRSQGALSPLYAALDANFARDFIGKIVITEGITDYCFFKMAIAHLHDYASDITFVPGAGASTLSTLISLGVAFSDQYCVLLDNDKDGIDAMKTYKKQFGKDCQRRTYLYGGANLSEKFELEDHFDKHDQGRLRDITGSKNLKKCLLFLYYDATPSARTDFWVGMSGESKGRLSATIDAIRERIKE